MKTTSFTRDEVILALDVLYAASDQRVSANDAAMADLSALLQRLPIHPVENRRADFRTIPGVTTQLNRFRRALASGKNNDHIGSLFFEIYFNFEERMEELHEIAVAIRRNEPTIILASAIEWKRRVFPRASSWAIYIASLKSATGAKCPWPIIVPFVA